MSLLVVAVSAALALLAPTGALLLSPLLLGPAHLAADAWCLFTRAPRRLAGSFLVAAGLPLAALTAKRLFVGGAFAWPATDILLGAAAVACAAAAAEASWARRGAALAVVGVLAALGARFPDASHAVILHGHNLLAFGLWLWLARPLTRADRWAAVLYGGLTAALALGLAPLAGAGALAGFLPQSMQPALAPGLPAEAARRWVWLFAFGQMVHYGAWLILLPKVLAAGTWSREWAELRRQPWAVPAVLVCLATAGAGMFWPLKARIDFLSLAGYHAWLELAVLVQWALSGSPQPEPGTFSAA